MGGCAALPLPLVLTNHPTRRLKKNPTTNQNPHTTRTPMPFARSVHSTHPLPTGGERQAWYRCGTCTPPSPRLFFAGCSRKAEPVRVLSDQSIRPDKPLGRPPTLLVQLVWSRPRNAVGQWFLGHQSLLRPGSWQFPAIPSSRPVHLRKEVPGAATTYLLLGPRVI